MILSRDDSVNAFHHAANPALQNPQNDVGQNHGCVYSTVRRVCNALGPLSRSTLRTLSPVLEQNASATFSVTATNRFNFRQCYQWRRDGQDIPGATTDSYAVTNAIETGL